jgi:hypothetical protein
LKIWTFHYPSGLDWRKAGPGDPVNLDSRVKAVFLFDCQKPEAIMGQPEFSKIEKFIVLVAVIYLFPFHLFFAYGFVRRWGRLTYFLSDIIHHQKSA